MTKIISIIVSIVMLVMTSIFPGFVWPGTKTVETGAFLEQVDEAFGYQAVESTEEIIMTFSLIMIRSTLQRPLLRSS